MPRKAVLLLLIFFLVATLSAQQAPGRYIVELHEPPVADVVAQDGRPDRAHSPRAQYSRIQREQALFRRALARISGEEISSMTTLANAVAVRLTPDRVAELERLPVVKRVYPVYQMKAQLDAAPAVHGAPQAWQKAGGSDVAGLGVKIGIIDSCIESTHPAFTDPWLPMPPGYPRASRPEDLAATNNKVIVMRNYKPFYGVDGDLSPFNPGAPHGTQVASAAAASPHMSPHGLISGMAPKAWVGSYCVSHPDQSITTSPADILAKALDDAVADGMDVINMSIGSANTQLRPRDDIIAKMVERAMSLGTLIVFSAGNNGPLPNTIGNYSAMPEAISVGATWNSRLEAGVLRVGDANYLTIPSGGTAGLAPVTAPVVDVMAMDGNGFGCADYAPGSLAGKIAFMTLGGGCKTAVKAEKMRDAGAVGAIIAADKFEVNVFRIGKRAIPCNTVSEAAGQAIRAQIAANPAVPATLQFDVSVRPRNPHTVAAFSSRGPTGDHRIKPDLVAVGEEVYMASTKGEWITANGTSFSAPITAGAMAVLKAARPGLTARQYRSLLINSASPPQPGGNSPPRIMDYGAGVLNLDAAVSSTVAAYPTSLNYGVANGTFSRTLRLVVMNLSGLPSTLNLSVAPHTPGPAPVLSANSLNIPGGKAMAVQVAFQQAGLPAGEYQGYIVLQSNDGSVARVPYWAGVPYAEPAHITVLGAEGSGTAGQRLNWAFYFRVVDRNGIVLNDAPVTVTPVQGGGSVFRVDSHDSVFPGRYVAHVNLGPNPGTNAFRIQAGPAQHDVYIEGKAPNAGNAEEEE